MLQHVKALLLDISGVLVNGDDLIPGSLDAIKELRSTDLILRFVTNTASKTHQQILETLKQQGFALDQDELITAPLAAKRYLLEKQLRPYCLIHKNLKTEFSDINQQQPNAVLLGDAREELNYVNLNEVFRLCHTGAPLIGIGLNKYFNDGKQLCLDAGMFIKGMEWASSQTAVIMGKPSKDFFSQIVRSTGVRADECLMVGDDVESDVIGAIEAGLKGCLVKTGKYQTGDEDRLSKSALVFTDLAALVKELIKPQ